MDEFDKKVRETLVTRPLCLCIEEVCRSPRGCSCQDAIAQALREAVEAERERQDLLAEEITHLRNELEAAEKVVEAAVWLRKWLPQPGHKMPVWIPSACLENFHASTAALTEQGASTSESETGEGDD